MAQKKLIKEEGLVLGREIKEATSEFVSKDGVVVPAQPEKYIIHVVTSSVVDVKNGMSYITTMDFPVDSIEYEKFTYMKKVDAIFELVATSTGFANKPVKLILQQ